MSIVYSLWEKSWEDGAQNWQAEPEMAYDPSKIHKVLLSIPPLAYILCFLLFSAILCKRHGHLLMKMTNRSTSKENISKSQPSTKLTLHPNVLPSSFKPAPPKLESHSAPSTLKQSSALPPLSPLFTPIPPPSEPLLLLQAATH